MEIIDNIKSYFSSLMLTRILRKKGYDDRKMYSLSVCRGNKCPRSVIDTQLIAQNIENKMEEINLAERLQKKIKSPRILPHHMFKIAVSGCPNGCSRPQIKDLGIVGVMKVKVVSELCDGCGECAAVCKENAIEINQDVAHINDQKCLYCGDCMRSCSREVIQSPKRGFNLLVGGHLGRHPHLADEIYTLTGQDFIIDQLEKYGEIFIKYSPGKRLGKILEDNNLR